MSAGPVRPYSIVLDATAFSALAAGSRTMQPWATMARRTDSTLHASAVTLAEVTDGSARDAEVRRAAKAVRLEPVTPEIGYLAGRLRAGAAAARRKPRDLTLDAIVAATALSLPSPVVVVTADDRDLRRLLDASDITVEAI